MNWDFVLGLFGGAVMSAVAFSCGYRIGSRQRPHVPQQQPCAEQSSGGVYVCNMPQPLRHRHQRQSGLRVAAVKPKGCDNWSEEMAKKINSASLRRMANWLSALNDSKRKPFFTPQMIVPRQKSQ